MKFHLVSNETVYTSPETTIHDTCPDALHAFAEIVADILSTDMRDLHKNANDVERAIVNYRNEGQRTCSHSSHRCFAHNLACRVRTFATSSRRRTLTKSRVASGSHDER